jgi:hypothetical protein
MAAGALPFIIMVASGAMLVFGAATVRAVVMASDTSKTYLLSRTLLLLFLL